MTLTIIILVLIFFGGVLFKKGENIKSVFQKEKKHLSIDDAYNARRKEKEDEIDRLLSKIGKNGLGDLSEKERKRLDELSKK